MHSSRGRSVPHALDVDESAFPGVYRGSNASELRHVTVVVGGDQPIFCGRRTARRYMLGFADANGWYLSSCVFDEVLVDSRAFVREARESGYACPKGRTGDVSGVRAGKDVDDE